jgi:hypothetical protein
MSLPTVRQAYAFLAPLKSKSSIFVVGSTEANLSLAHFIFNCLEVIDASAHVFDIDAFYGSNAIEVTRTSSPDFLENVSLSIPKNTTSIEYWLVDELAQCSEGDAILVHDLNTVYHSIGDSRSALKRLSLIMALLSFLARTKRQIALSTLYERDRLVESRLRQRSLNKLGDLTISVKLLPKALSFECTRGKAWKGNSFSIRLNP